MNIKTDFPRPIREIEHLWIPLPDGSRLAARLWLPADAAQNPVPAILEYIPYRKIDNTAERDAIRHPYVAGHGYACVRVDIRGSGESDGIMYDEYLATELRDGVDVIAWIAEQAWCTGKVGMIGKSWGGFNGLQIAALRPPALKTIITVCSTDDRYADDVHYRGGCLLASDMLSWASTMLAYNGRPPDPRFVGEKWREMWLERLEKTPPFVEAWLSHQRRDAFWKHGSVCENYGDIDCSVYAVGGWNDGYSNAVLRLLAGLSAPAKGLIGPWSHEYPESASRPGPAIGFNQECVRWWDYWLKDIDNGIMDEPPLRAWMLDSIPADPSCPDWPGRWVAEAGWPLVDEVRQRWFLNDEGRMTEDGKVSRSSVIRPPSGKVALTGKLQHGLAAGAWCSFGLDGELPDDQAVEDGLSLCFTSSPVAERVEILGFPEVTVRLAVDEPQALLAVRLCDVAPDGSSRLVSRGLLNLTHGEGHETVEELVPGRVYTFSLQLNGTAYALPAGHRWRLAVSPTYWPHAWPSPQLVTLTLFTGAGCQLTLPIRQPKAIDARLRPFDPPEISAPLPLDVLRTPRVERERTYDVLTGEHVLRLFSDTGLKRVLGSGAGYEGGYNGLTFSDESTVTYSIKEGEPLSARVACDWVIVTGREETGWQTRIETHSDMTADATHFHVTNTLDAYEGDTRVFTKSRTFSVKRDGV